VDDLGVEEPREDPRDGDHQDEGLARRLKVALGHHLSRGVEVRRRSRQLPESRALAMETACACAKPHPLQQRHLMFHHSHHLRCRHFAVAVEVHRVHRKIRLGRTPYSFGGGQPRLLHPGLELGRRFGDGDVAEQIRRREKNHEGDEPPERRALHTSVEIVPG